MTPYVKRIFLPPLLNFYWIVLYQISLERKYPCAYGVCRTLCVKSKPEYTFPRKYASQFALQFKVCKAHNYLGRI